MARHSIPADAFFMRSPRISVLLRDASNVIIEDAESWTQQYGHLGCQVDPFWRASADAESDAHLARLLGIQKMYASLRDLDDEGISYRVYYGDKLKKGWRSWIVDGHPYSMLCGNDKLWMKHQKAQVKLSYHRANGLSRTQHTGEMQAIFGLYAQAQCLYCNGDYDDIIIRTLGLETGGKQNTANTWTGQEDIRRDGPSKYL